MILDGFTIDADMYETLKNFKWRPDKDGYGFSRITIEGKKVQISMHRLIVAATEGQLVDHRNGDVTDNQRHNLRIVNAFQSACNRGAMKGSKSQYKGVFFRNKNGRNYWIARMKIKGKIVLEKWVHDEKEAARLYDAAAKVYHGEYARLNFPDTGSL